MLFMDWRYFGHRISICIMCSQYQHQFIEVYHISNTHIFGGFCFSFVTSWFLAVSPELFTNNPVSRYIAVEYNAILNTIPMEGNQNFVHTMNSQKSPIPRPYGRAMGRYRERTVLSRLAVSLWKLICFIWWPGLINILHVGTAHNLKDIDYELINHVLNGSFSLQFRRHDSWHD